MSEKKEKTKEEEEKERTNRFLRLLEEDTRKDIEAAKQFAPLTKAILQGTAQTEDATVTTHDGKKHRVSIKALSEGEVMEALDAAGLEFVELGLKPRELKFQQILCSKAIVGEAWTPAEIAKALRFSETARLATRILRLSGFLSLPAEAIDLFRPEQPAVV